MYVRACVCACVCTCVRVCVLHGFFFLLTDTDLTEARQPLAAEEEYAGTRTVTVDTAPGKSSRVTYIGTARQEADSASIVSFDDGEEDETLSGEEILFRLRLAHIYGK